VDGLLLSRRRLDEDVTLNHCGNSSSSALGSGITIGGGGGGGGMLPTSSLDATLAVDTADRVSCSVRDT
jgi:hypothetical protein